MNLLTLLDHLTRGGVELVSIGGELHTRDPNGVLDEAAKQALHDRRDEVMELLARDAAFGGDQSVDWAAESTLPADIRPQGAPSPKLERVLVTGATGFLGAFLVRDLLRVSKAEVYCLVRADSDARAMERLRAALAPLDAHVANPRLRAVPGDVALPRLGMRSEPYRELAGSVDAVFHAAAEVDWMKPYAGLRGANVDGVLEILRFGMLERVKRLIHVSTLGVFPAVADTPVVVGEEEFIDSPELLPLSYSRSKWVGEALVRGAQARGLPAIICRPYYLAGSTSGGVWSSAEFICRLVLSAMRTGVYCAEYAATRFVLSPVDRVSDAIVRIGLSDRANGVYHLAPAAATPFVAYIDAMARCGVPCRPLNHLDWVRQVLSAEPLLTPFSAALRLEEAPGRRGALVSYDSRRTAELLGSTCPGFCVEQEHLDAAVTRLRALGTAGTS